MGRISFVAMLFVMALACLGMAVSALSWGWAIGGIAFVVVGVYALRQFNTELESESGTETASSKFAIFAMLVVVVGIAGIAFLARN
jgi:peptidoglycan biosynthesis protein MviN/MurJ (putative lipid II flippase)